MLTCFPVDCGVRSPGIQDKAFTHCTTCNFEYQYEAKEPGCCTCSQETQYRLLIFRDVMTVLLIILGECLLAQEALH